MIVHLILYVAVTNGTVLSPSDYGRVITRQEITVSAGIPKEQIELERECDRLIKEAQTTMSAGELSKALALLENAWQLTQKYEFLAARKPSIAAERGHAYLANRDYKQAVLAFQVRLDFEKRSCEKKYDASPYAIGCGEALFELGSAELLLGDNASALSHLRESAACYEIFMDKGQDSAPLAKLGYRLYFGEAKVRAGVAAGRNGDKAGGISLINTGIESLEKVQADPISNAQLKELAARAVSSAKEQLSLLK